ncbi:hypothetical protein AS200_10315 [Streptomyces sp. CdTB01]|nr:hypothetical protein AS200_10315 [Streptomyces sp. CdTB01]
MSGRSPIPVPIAMTDSPNATISSSPCRSTKCAGSSRPSCARMTSADRPSARPGPCSARNGVTNCRSSASTHRPSAARPSTRPAAVTDSAASPFGTPYQMESRPWLRV